MPIITKATLKWIASSIEIISASSAGIVRDCMTGNINTRYLVEYIFHGEYGRKYFPGTDKETAIESVKEKIVSDYVNACFVF